MTTYKDVLCLLAIFVAYGIVGRIDYEDAAGREQIIKERHHADCLMTPPADREALTRINDLSFDPSTRRTDATAPKTGSPARRACCEETAMHPQMRIAHDARSLLTVQAPEDIEFLAKESEVLTGRAGRIFVITGADWLAYRVHWHPIGLKAEWLNAEYRVLSTQYLLPREFLGHSLMEALAAGQLFTPPIRRRG